MSDGGRGRDDGDATERFDPDDLWRPADPAPTGEAPGPVPVPPIVTGDEADPTLADAPGWDPPPPAGPDAPTVADGAVDPTVVQSAVPPPGRIESYGPAEDGPATVPGEPFGPYESYGSGGPGDPGGPPPTGEIYGDPDDDGLPWYRQPGAIAAIAAGVAVIALGLLALFTLGGDDDNIADDATTTSSSSSTSTSSTTTPIVITAAVPPPPPTTPPPLTTPPPTTTLPPPTTQPPTTPPTTPPPTTTTPPTTTQPPTTPPTTEAPTTTQPPTTPPTTTEPPTTPPTTQPPTTPPTTTEPPTTPPTTTQPPTTPPTTTEPPTTPPTTTQPPTTPPTTTEPPTTPPTTTEPPTTPPTTTEPPTTPPTTQPPTTLPGPTTTSPRSATTTSSIAEQPTAWDYVAARSDLSQFRQYVERAGLVSQLQRSDVTVLAPIDQAFQDLAANPGGAELLADPARLRAVLERHLVVGSLTADQIFADGGPAELTTVSGDTLTVDRAARTIDGGRIVDADHRSTDGGLIQIIDPVLDGGLTG